MLQIACKAGGRWSEETCTFLRLWLGTGHGKPHPCSDKLSRPPCCTAGLPRSRMQFSQFTRLPSKSWIPPPHTPWSKVNPFPWVPTAPSPLTHTVDFANLGKGQAQIFSRRPETALSPPSMDRTRMEKGV